MGPLWLLFLLPLLPLAAPHVVISLDGSEWTARDDAGEFNIPARVPGGIYTDLRAAGVLKSDLFFGNNDREYRWVAFRNWTFERSFQVESGTLLKRHVQLVLHGADTVAEVRLNGQRVGAVDNMFVRYAFPVRALLREGANHLAVRFTSAPLEAARRDALHSARFGYKVPPACTPEEYNGECHVNYLRKMQASFGWDWGPAFPSQGLWKNVTLEAFDSAVLRAVTVQFVEPAPAPASASAGAAGLASLRVRAFLELGVGSTEAVEGTLGASLALPQGDASNATAVRLVPGARGEAALDIYINDFQEPARWWPAGEGAQALHALRVWLEARGGERSELRRRVAYRSVELVQEPVHPPNTSSNDVRSQDPNAGLSFFVRVNGRALFAKGANWIPLSAVPELGAEPARVEALLRAARDANMNMLRVWGGGVYESDRFYDVADELGLLVWQDMMFACSMYPADKAFLQSARREARQQVLRLQSHASVAVWAGNNENEGALVDNWYQTSRNFSTYKSDYVTLYAKTIRRVVMALDPTRPFVVSSPSNGLKTDEEGFVSKNPSSSLYGDVHYYNYLSDGWQADALRRPRFASEYGFQSLPTLATLRAAADAPSALALASAFLRARQHHGDGYGEMVALVARRLPLPARWDEAPAFAAVVFLSQIYQAVAVQTQTEHYRRLRSQLSGAGEGLCMGALYWQLNDVWAAPSWSSIDFEGRWKPLQHLAAEFFAPQMASAFVDVAGRLHVWALNDRPAPVLGVVLQARAGRWASFAPPRWTNLTDAFTLGASCSQHVLTEALAPRLLELPGCAGADASASAAECFLLLRLLSVVDGLPLGPERLVLPVAPRSALHLSAPAFQVEWVRGPDAEGALEVQLRSDRPALFVWLEVGALRGRFERNAFIMADPVQRVRFLPAPGSEPPTADQLRQAITVTSVVADTQA